METNQFLMYVAIVIVALIIFSLLKHLIKFAIILAVLGVIIFFVGSKFSILPSYQGDDLEFVRLPVGFTIETFADDLGGSLVSTPGPNPGPRMLAVKEDIVFVTLPSKGQILALEDKNKDSKVEGRKIFIEGLNKPHGIAISGDYMYIAEEDKVIRVKDTNKDNIADPTISEKLLDLPSGSHWTRTVKIINNKLYVSIGSSCNVCNEEDARRATIQECDLEGKNCTTYAKGLRNTVDFIEKDGKIYGTDNGRDGLGDELPPEEVNTIEKDKNYGWPTCYGNKIHDTEFDKNTYIRDPCLDTEAPLLELPAHSAPLGLAFYEGKTFPSEYQNKLFIAYHGSWNRQEPTGYKIVLADVNTKQIRDFATGWQNGKLIKGRPVSIINFRDSLLVSDDNAGKIYRIYY